MSAAHCFDADSVKQADKKFFVVLGEFDRYSVFFFFLNTKTS